MEEAIISKSIQQRKLLETVDKMDMSGFVLNLLKNEVTQLENEITRKDVIIKFLTNKLLQTHSRKFHIDQKSMTYNNRNIESKNNNLHAINKIKDTEITKESENQADKEIKVVVSSDLLLNGISEKSLLKNFRKKVKNLTKTILTNG